MDLTSCLGHQETSTVLSRLSSSVVHLNYMFDTMFLQRIFPLITLGDHQASVVGVN